MFGIFFVLSPVPAHAHNVSLRLTRATSTHSGPGGNVNLQQAKLGAQDIGCSPCCTQYPWCFCLQRRVLFPCIKSCWTVGTPSAPSTTPSRGGGLESSWSWEKREATLVLLRVGKVCRGGGQEIIIQQDHTSPPLLPASFFQIWTAGWSRATEDISPRRRVKSTSDEGPLVRYRGWGRCLQNKTEETKLCSATIILLPDTSVPWAFCLDWIA